MPVLLPRYLPLFRASVSSVKRLAKLAVKFFAHHVFHHIQKVVGLESSANYCLLLPELSSPQLLRQETLKLSLTLLSLSHTHSLSNQAADALSSTSSRYHLSPAILHQPHHWSFYSCPLWSILNFADRVIPLQYESDYITPSLKTH